MKIQNKVLFSVSLVLVLVLTIIGFVSFYAFNKIVINNTLQQLESISQAQLHNLKNIEHQNQEKIKLIVSRTQLRASLKEFLKKPALSHQIKMNKILRDLEKTIPVFIELSIISRDGVIVASTNQSLVNVKPTKEVYNNWKDIEDNNTHFFLDENKHITRYIFGRLILDDEFLGIVKLTISAKPLEQYVKDYTLFGDTGYTHILIGTDIKDKIIVSPERNALDEDFYYSSYNELGPISKQIWDKQLGSYSKIYGHDKTAYIVTTNYSDELKIGFSVRIARKEVLKPLVNFEYILLFMFIVGYILLVIIIRFITKAIINPITLLTDFAKKIGEGDFTQRVKINTNDELEILSESFNLMNKKTKNFIEVQKNIQDKLAISENKHRSLYENVPLAYQSLDLDGNIIDVNPYWLNELQYEREEVIGKYFGQFMHPESADDFHKNYIKAIETGSASDVQLKLVRKDGKIIDASFEGTIGYNPDGTFKQTYSVFHDITEKKEAENKIIHLNSVLNAIRNVDKLITNEKDVNNLINGICNILVETRSYNNAWIALYNEIDEFSEFGECGIGDKFTLFTQELKSGKDTYCINKALETDDCIFVDDPIKCKGCLLRDTDSKFSGLSSKLGYDGKVYGVLTISISKKNFNNEKELKLFKEIVNDVSFALHNIRVAKEQKLAEKIHKDDQEKYYSIIETTSEGFWLLDVNEISLDVNQSLCNMLGYTSEELIGMNPFELVDDENRKIFEKQISTEKTTIHRKYEVVLTKKNGGKVPTIINATTLLDDNKNFKGTFAFVTDITERKLAEKEIQTREKTYRTLVNNLPGFVYRCLNDKDYSMNYISKGCSTITGYTPEEFVNNSISYGEIIDKAYRKSNWELWQTAIKNDAIFEYEYPIITKNGETKWVWERGSVTYNDEGKIEYFEGFITEITEHKKAKRELNESEERYKNITNNLLVGIVIQVKNKVVFANKQIEKLLGVSADDYLEKNILEFVHPDDREMVKNTTFKFFADPQDFMKNKPPIIEQKLLKKDGSFIITEVSPVLMNYYGEKALLLMVQDITEQKKIQEEFQRIERLESIGTLAAGIAHDFNNILTGIYGNIAIAEMDIPEGHRSLKYIKQAQESMDRATKLTKQLLTFSKGGVPIKESVQLSEVIMEVVKFDLSGSNVKPIFDIEENLYSVEVDKGQIQQVFSNLTINANQASPNGGHLYVSMSNEVINEKEITNLTSGNYIKITVRDEGSGISQENIDKIFDPYFTTKETGNGLGLATTYSIIKKHNGEIQIDSELGKGTTFSIYLPSVKTQNKIEEREAMENTLNTDKTPKILLMDDEESICKLVSRMMTRIGYEIKTVSHGEEAVAEYKESFEKNEAYDVVILDLTIPGKMGGLEAVKLLLELNPNVKVIVSSGYSSESDMGNWKEQGFKKFINKPYTMQMLKDTIIEVMNS